MFNIYKIFSRNDSMLRILLIGLFIIFSVLLPLHISNVTSYVSASPISTLDHIQKKGELVVGTSGDMPPLNMTTKDGEIIGLEPDIAKLIADGMGVKLRFEKMPFSKLLEAYRVTCYKCVNLSIDYHFNSLIIICSCYKLCIRHVGFYK